MRSLLIVKIKGICANDFVLQTPCARSDFRIPFGWSFNHNDLCMTLGGLRPKPLNHSLQNTRSNSHNSQNRKKKSEYDQAPLRKSGDDWSFK